MKDCHFLLAQVLFAAGNGLDLLGLGRFAISEVHAEELSLAEWDEPFGVGNFLPPLGLREVYARLALHC